MTTTTEKLETMLDDLIDVIASTRAGDPAVLLTELSIDDLRVIGADAELDEDMHELTVQEATELHGMIKRMFTQNQTERSQ
jgi:hypothetical protein